MFSRAKALRPVNFFEKVLRLTVGRFRGKPFSLLPWQLFALCHIFGNVDSVGSRLCREAFIQVAKKNGKSEFAAGVALYLLLCDNEPAAHIYGAAASIEQAGIVFHTAAEMVGQSRHLSDRLIVRKRSKRIYLRRDPASFYQVISSDAATGDGINPHAMIFDEVHRQRDTELYSIGKFGMAAREQPLMFGITTAGAEGESPVAQAGYMRAKLRETGVSDPKFFGLVFEGNRKRWKVKGKAGRPVTRATMLKGGKNLWRRKPTGWYAGNPSLEGNPGGFLKLADLEDAAAAAEAAPVGLNDFLRLRLDIWTESVNRWIPGETWKKCGRRLDLEKLEGRRCWVGADLSTTRDITAVAFLFEPEEDGAPYVTFGRYYLPQEGIDAKARRDNQPYPSWASQGHLTLTPGPTIDYHRIYQDIIELSKLYDIQSVTMDRWNAQSIADDLSEAGLELTLIGQGFGDVNAGLKELERMIHKGPKAFQHDRNPVLAYNCACAEALSNANGDIRLKKPDRLKSTKRIDGMVALGNAMVGHIDREEEEETIFLTA